MNRLLIYVFSNYFHYHNETGTNLYKQKLFAMAIRTPTGITFLGRYMIIPLSKKWVFHAIFRHAFLSLHGDSFVGGLSEYHHKMDMSIHGPHR
jgi:hypothetical protein